MENNIKDENYYNALQSAVLNYDGKLWQIPGLFFTVVGLLITKVSFNTYDLTLENGVIFLFVSIFLFILISLYTKAHIFHLSISKKINEIDNIFNGNNKDSVQRIPLTSMDTKELEKRINSLEGKYLKDPADNEGAKFDCFQKFIAKGRISSWIRKIMLITSLITFSFSIFCFFHYLLK